MASSVLVLLFIIIVAIAILFLVRNNSAAAVGAAGALGAAVGAGESSYNYHTASSAFGKSGGDDSSAALAANAATAAANDAIDIMYTAPKVAVSGEDKFEAKKLDDQLNAEVAKVLNSARVVIGTYTNDVNSLPTAITSSSDYDTMHTVLSKAASANQNNKNIADVLNSANVFKRIKAQLY